MANLGIMEKARKLLDAAARRAAKQDVENRRTTGASSSKRGNDTTQSIPLPIWMETVARVAECHRELSKVRKLALRVRNDADNVIVSFTYYAHAQIYYDHFSSPVERTQGEAFSVYYNALNPRQNTFSPPRFVNHQRLSDTTILSSILVSILLLVMTSC
jgi:hypothetical protein